MAKKKVAELAAEGPANTIIPQVTLSPDARLFTDKELEARGGAYARAIGRGQLGNSEEARVLIMALFYPLDAADILAVKAVSDALSAERLT